MFLSLARKYRSQNFSQLLGQDLLVKTLTNAINNNQIPQAILLNGIRGVGKTTTARIIAKCLNCKGKSAKETVPQLIPCDVCESCKSILIDRHMDVIEIDAASHNGVEDIREITESVKYKAIQGRYKIYIIDEVHMLSKAAFNGLLKTLEEPPSHVKFILATTEIQKIPETILSRCIRFDLKTINPEIIVEQLQNILHEEKVEFEIDALAQIAKSGDGSMRDSISLLDRAISLTNKEKITNDIIKQMLGLANKDQIFDLYKEVYQGNATEVIQIIRKMLSEGCSPQNILNYLQDTMYWMICIKNVPNLHNNIAWPESDRINAAEIVKNITISTLLQSWDLLLKIQEDIKLAPYKDQSLIIGLMRLMYVKEIIDGGSFDKLTQGQSNPRNFGGLQALNSKSPETFLSLLDKVLQSKEVLMHSYLYHDVCVVDYFPFKMTISITKRVPKNFVKQLQNVLLKITSNDWEIITVEFDTTNHLSQNQLDIIKKEQEYQEAVSHPLIKNILQSFPNSKITVH